MPMRRLERIFHAVLFELFAILFTVIGMSLFTSHHTGLLTGTIVSISIVAMLWNMLFNTVFDHIFTAPRETRTVGLRIFHTLAFEGGLLLFTIPLVAYMLDVDWWSAFIMDIGMTLFVIVYAFFFNLSYDHLRVWWFKRSSP
ncbi:PACE efflux transporter [Actinobacillus equuli subsp. haemolyticus]|uniref:PACE efflux transporter n=1 Tax=Actinobacillus equuli TaxID=718 RepID=UPI002442192D|nr:PACE efflux transporter [Actinobacillus equuli]WGE50381.1 PACE efflux transporter [Actinobacillus equuli subsp. haemolyticus]WGE58783.1 PACE efflux transporter [Actinobacillus equuli subsp. haemolyticus]WGE60623.1 PACE efflux transporter [Actinobacillus equuli subsp. haemolyticus]WGE62810.1 PACE efflux transporter [Actinobacillus equuli subsp. haemolyticus]WGE80978.1 PACE efflux transporter [Actinobacillus equuli subsp. haemolyticus]